MSFFVDTNVLVYAVTPGPRRDGSLTVLEAIGAGAPGTTSVAVLEELWHLELGGRLPDLHGQTRRTRTLFDDLLAVGPRTLDLALGLGAPDQLGAADRLHAATCMEHGIDTIVTADRAFDSVAGLRRVDPGDESGLAKLLGESG